MAEPTFSWSREGGKLLREEHKLRLALSLLLILFLFTGREATTDLPSVIMAVFLVIGGLLLSLVATKTERGVGVQQVQLNAVALSVLDLIAVTLLCRGTGGLHSGFFCLYLLSLVFAAAFFRGLELALLTALAVVFFTGVSVFSVDSVQDLWHLSGQLFGLILVAWYSYSLTGVLHREKENNDQLLRHLTEGVILFDRDEKVTLVNSTLLQMVGDTRDGEFVGRKRAELAGRDKVLAWMLGDVGTELNGYSTRIGCFPDADLPLVECTTIPCASESDTGGWVVVCKDLRDLKMETKTSRQACDKLAPLSNLRALSEALYGMAEYLDDKRRWQAVEIIEKHTLALQSILAEMLHQGQQEAATLELDFVDVSSLLASTRRLLEIQPGGLQMEVAITCQQGLPEINADRARIGQCLLQLCKGLLAVGTPDDRLVIDARSDDREVVFSLEVVPRADGGSHTPAVLSDQELAEFGEMCELPVFAVIDEHQGHWDCRPDSSHFRRVVFSLPVSGPSHMADQVLSDGKLVRIPARGIAPPLEPSLAAEITNQLRNTLSVIRGYAEMAVQSAEPERQQDALRYAIELSDQASDLVETLQPSTGEFDLEVKTSPAAETAPLAEPGVAQATEGAILVVDDDRAMRGLIVDVLKSAGYRTVEANDGKQAVERLRLAQPAMAFVDLSMPRVTGVEVMREARKYAPGLQVVLMTGYATQVAVEALGDEKPYAILSKPFTITDVLSLARAVLGDQATPGS